MKLNEVIDNISELYRAELKQIRNMHLQVMELQDELRKAGESDWKNISVARRNDIHSCLTDINHRIDIHTRRAEGIDAVRELFLDKLNKRNEE